MEQKKAFQNLQDNEALQVINTKNVKHSPNKPSKDEKFQINRVICDAPSADNYKTVIKLDKNFHIYKHGSSKLIERGYSKKKKMKFIKIYYNEEALQ